MSFVSGQIHAVLKRRPHTLTATHCVYPIEQTEARKTAETLRAQVQTLRAQLGAATDAHADTTARLAATTAALTEKEATLAQVHQTDTTVDTLRGRVSTLEEAFAAKESECDSLRAESAGAVAAVQAQLEVLSAGAESSQKTVQFLQRENADHAVTIKRLTSDLAEARADASAQTRRATGLDDTLGDLKVCVRVWVMWVSLCIYVYILECDAVRTEQNAHFCYDVPTVYATPCTTLIVISGCLAWVCQVQLRTSEDLRATTEAQLATATSAQVMSDERCARLQREHDDLTRTVATLEQTRDTHQRTLRDLEEQVRIAFRKGVDGRATREKLERGFWKRGLGNNNLCYHSKYMRVWCYTLWLFLLLILGLNVSNDLRLNQCEVLRLYEMADALVITSYYLAFAPMHLLPSFSCITIPYKMIR